MVLVTLTGAAALYKEERTRAGAYSGVFRHLEVVSNRSRTSPTIAVVGSNCGRLSIEATIGGIIIRQLVSLPCWISPPC